jgi:hypothetical protein
MGREKKRVEQPCISMRETTQILFVPLEDEGAIEQRRGDRIGWEVSQA